jgi:hypothetical protein
MKTDRVLSIDILRALTMVLMIFVNDLWSLKDIPSWLGHVEKGVDGIGLADTVFPAFLFLVGMSIPFAFQNRLGKGDTRKDLAVHVILRTAGLLTMGVFLVNGEDINAAATGIPGLLWNVICCTCFLLIWGIYPGKLKPSYVMTLKTFAAMVLLILAIMYRGGEEAGYLSPKWWGILGLIGWSYLAAGFVYILSGDRIWAVAIAWIMFSLLSIFWHAGMIPAFLKFIPHSIIGGTEAGLAVGGVLTSMVFRHYLLMGNNRGLTAVLLAFGALLVFLSILVRPYWGLAKLGATPAWLFLCSAFTIFSFVTVYWLVDVWNKASWFDMIKPAGTDTLLTYLIPYYAYATTALLGIHLPQFLLSGFTGLIKSFVFALLCVYTTKLLTGLGVRIKL